MVRIPRPSHRLQSWRLYEARLDRTDTRRSMGLHSLRTGPKAAGIIFGRSRQLASYWERKVVQNDFHAQRHGGVRRDNLLQYRGVIKEMIKYISLQRSSTPYKEYKRLVKQLFDLNVSISYIRALVAESNLRYVSFVFPLLFFLRLPFLTLVFLLTSWQVTSHRQINKYTESNMQLYADYLGYIVTVPLNHLKFLDESHFNSRGTVSYYSFLDELD